MYTEGVAVPGRWSGMAPILGLPLRLAAAGSRSAVPRSPSLTDRLRQADRLLRTEGAAGVSARLRARAAQRLVTPGSERLPVDPADLAGAAELAAAGRGHPPPIAWRPGQALEIAWVCVPPGGGSGGHTTMFRIASALAASGHRCTFYLHDRHGWRLEQHVRTIRHWWPWLKADIKDFADGMADSHVVMATAWETAYPVLASPAGGIRCYFLQDFEPSFHPAGSAAMLAEATYRFGFHGIAAGRWLAGRVRRDYGMTADHFEFGCDLDRYALEPDADAADERAGICYYCRPSTPRRAHELAVLALQLFAERHPETEIHLFGESVRRLPFAATHHGLLDPEQLGRLYHRCIAGLALSATNVSLVPLEMLAAGCLPVVNDAEHNRVVLDNPHVVYTGATPFELAAALERLVMRPASAGREAAAAAAASVKGASWADAGRCVERSLLRLISEATEDQGRP